MSQRQPKRDVDGILLVHKPKNLTSNATLQQLKRLFQANKAGHSGTLDPLATGMLPICFGEATKFSRFLLDADKTYEVTAQLGVVTDSGDADGNITASKQVGELSNQQLQQTLDKFVGQIAQIPPMHSAIKYRGTPLYKLARQGIDIKREPRQVQIYALTLLHYANAELRLRVRCSKGTYIRSLVVDIGDALGCGAHVKNLHREAVAGFSQSAMVAFDILQTTQLTQGVTALDQYLLPITNSLRHLPIMHCDNPTVTRLYHGQAIEIKEVLPEGWVQLLTLDERFFGVGRLLPNNKLLPQRLLKRHQHN